MSDRCEELPPALAGPGGSPDIHTVLQSPSLFTSGGGGSTAFELKFLLTEEQAACVAARIATRLALDPYADPALGNAYLTTSVYTDTPARDVLRRTGAVGGRKYRVRRYGTKGPVFVERKTRSGDEVRKRRSPAPDGDLSPLEAASPLADWPGEWFRQQAADRQLRPVCRISYERVAYMGPSDGGAVRATFDRNVRGVFASSWEVAPVAAGANLLDGRVICEFKFRDALPAIFKATIEELALAPSVVSKYRLFMETVRPVAVGEGG